MGCSAVPRSLLPAQLGAWPRGAVVSHSSSLSLASHLAVFVWMQSPGSAAGRSTQVWGARQVGGIQEVAFPAGLQLWTGNQLGALGRSGFCSPAACSGRTRLCPRRQQLEGEVRAGQWECASNRWCCSVTRSSRHAPRFARRPAPRAAQLPFCLTLQSCFPSGADSFVPGTKAPKGFAGGRELSP